MIDINKEIDDIGMVHEDEYWKNLIIKIPRDRELSCESLNDLIFIGYSKLDGNPIYKINLPRGFAV